MNRCTTGRMPLALAIALLAFPPAPIAAQEQAQTPALRMQNVELTAFIQDVARATGTTFIVDPRVQGTVNISRDRPMSDQDLIGVLLAVLRSNGLIAVPAGTATYRVVPDESGAQQPGTPLGFATSVFPLQRIDARAAAETLKPLLGRGGVVMALPQGNSLLVADYADNLRRIRGLVSQIDHDTASIDTVSLRNTSARELAVTLSELYGASAQANTALSILPVDSSNSLLVRGSPSIVQRVTRMAMELDARAERSGDVAVVRLQHASAEQLLPVLQQLIGQTPDSQTGATINASALQSSTTVNDAANAQVIGPASGKRPVIVRYPGSNSLIVHADPDTQRILLDVIRQLDVRREQVLVEALVVEISDEAAKKLGVQLLLAGKDGNVPVGATQFGSAEPGILPLVGGALAQRSRNRDPERSDSVADLARQAAAQSLLGLSGGLLGIGGESDDHLFGVIINAVKSDTDSSLLSTPSILTLDNEEAHILVGQEVPITTGEVLGANNDNPFRTIDRKDVGIRLAVKPQINTGGGVTLHIKQEVSSVNGTVSSRSEELVLNKREIENRVVVDDGAIIAIGGLLDHSGSVRSDKVPLLGDIPMLGALFRSKSRLSSKTNLMVFLRPTVIRNAVDAQRHTAQRYGYLRDTGLRGDPAALAELDAVVRDYLHANPPELPLPSLPSEPLSPEPATPQP